MLDFDWFLLFSFDFQQCLQGNMSSRRAHHELYLIYFNDARTLNEVEAKYIFRQLLEGYNSYMQLFWIPCIWPSNLICVSDDFQDMNFLQTVNVISSVLVSGWVLGDSAFNTLPGVGYMHSKNVIHRDLKHLGSVETGEALRVEVLIPSSFATKRLIHTTIQQQICFWVHFDHDHHRNSSL